jgi:hypothetical protein
VAIGSLLGRRTAIVIMRPCCPLHTIADVGRIGGSQLPMPGEGIVMFTGTAALWGCRVGP